MSYNIVHIYNVKELVQTTIGSKQCVFFIQGQNKMLAFYRSPALRPGVETNVEARLWPGQWFIDYRGGNRATRRDILRSGSSLYFVGRTAISVFILYRNTEYLYSISVRK